MAQSEDIAALCGPVALVTGVSMVLNRPMWDIIVAQLANDLGLVLLTGPLLLLAGLAILRVHNIWPGDWRLLVTMTGWVLVLSGLVRTLFFGQIVAAAPHLMQVPFVMPIATAMMVVLGAVLTVQGFRTSR